VWQITGSNVGRIQRYAVTSGKLASPDPPTGNPKPRLVGQPPAEAGTNLLTLEG
jgi:hypothetical protein